MTGAQGGPAAIVFDLDGTLVDSAPDIHAAASDLLEAEGLEPLPLPVVRGFIGNGVPVLVQRIMATRAIPDDDATRRRLERAFLDRYEAASAVLTKPFPGVAQAIEALARRGHPIGVCTNKPLAPSRDILSALGLDRHVAVIVGGDSLPQRKPDPAPLLATFAGLDGRDRLYVGDSEVDAETAARAGIAFALFTEGYRKAPVGELAHAMTFARFADLPDLIARRGLARA